jgi:hypothetical protein
VAYKFALGDSFFTALDAAEQQQRKLRDTGPISYAEGSPMTAEDPEFSRTGALAGFRGEVDENWENYFKGELDKFHAWEERQRSYRA